MPRPVRSDRAMSWSPGSAGSTRWKARGATDARRSLRRGGSGARRLPGRAEQARVDGPGGGRSVGHRPEDVLGGRRDGGGHGPAGEEAATEEGELDGAP